MSKEIDTTYFGSDGDPDHHHPSYRFKPKNDMTIAESALCSMAVALMMNGPNHSDFGTLLEQLGIIRHFVKIDR